MCVCVCVCVRTSSVWSTVPPVDTSTVTGQRLGTGTVLSSHKPTREMSRRPVCERGISEGCAAHRSSLLRRRLSLGTITSLTNSTRFDDGSSSSKFLKGLVKIRQDDGPKLT